MFLQFRINNILGILIATDDDLFNFQKSNTRTYSNLQFELSSIAESIAPPFYEEAMSTTVSSNFCNRVVDHDEQLVLQRIGSSAGKFES